MTETEKQAGGGWLFPALLAVVLVVAAGIAKVSRVDTQIDGTDAAQSGWTPSPMPEGKTVGLIVDFGNGALKQYEALPWQEGMTAETQMQEAARYRPGLNFSQQGTGETGLLRSIDGLENQGVDGQNWQYQVNGVMAKTSFCLRKLEPGDRVLWRFAGQE
ncbi:MAG: DUF4430 domain-containing protein [Planctomycetales bacterium]|nr:DUF4430 domain-containing protein [Planctomycetales bacterium]